SGPDTAAPDADQPVRSNITPKKAGPTPKRSEAESNRRGPYQAPADRKAALQQGKQRDKTSRATRAQAMQRGEEWALPAKDRGPVRALARDYVDSKRRFSEFYMYGLIVLLLLLFLRSPITATVLPAVLIFMIVVMAVEGFYIG